MTRDGAIAAAAPAIARQRGLAAEALVADALAARGWSILGRRVRAGRAELDLVALDPGPPGSLVVVEVRWRARRDFGLPEETVDWRKLRQLRAGMGRLLEAGALPDGRALPDAQPRLDLVVVEPPTVRGGPPRVRHHRGIG